MSHNVPVWFGFDAREMEACCIAERSARIVSRGTAFNFRRLALSELQASGIYTRPTLERGAGKTLWDELSDAPMSTAHAIGRFFVPLLSEYQGWAIFMDGDVLVRTDLSELLNVLDPRFAVMVVPHAPLTDDTPKKDGVPQMVYPRKNWSSVLAFNCAHPANQRLTLDVLNSWPGRDLHAFKWLRDEEIGALDPGWNYLVNAQPEPDPVHIAHFTLGTPNLPGHGFDPFADEWFAIARSAGYRLERS